MLEKLQVTQTIREQKNGKLWKTIIIDEEEN